MILHEFEVTGLLKTVNTADKAKAIKFGLKLRPGLAD